MKIDDEFRLILFLELKKNHNNLLVLRECLLKYKDIGMNKDDMLANLNKMRYESDNETEDILLELMDFVEGYCTEDLSIFS